MTQAIAHALDNVPQTDSAAGGQTDAQPEFKPYVDNYTFADKFKRLMWNVCCALLFRPFSLPQMLPWRLFVLRLWGAKLHKRSNVRASAKVWAPWNLQMEAYACIAPHVIVYNPGLVSIGEGTTISQYVYLCTASHDYTSPFHTLFWKPITIGAHVWVAARAFVGPGVTIGEGAVVGATASVYKDVEPWTIVGGNPARYIKRRVLREESEPQLQRT